MTASPDPNSTRKPTLYEHFPPIIPMVVIATVLITGAQFGSTEKLAAAFAWLIFVAVLLNDGSGAFQNIASKTAPPASTTKS